MAKKPKSTPHKKLVSKVLSELKFETKECFADLGLGILKQDEF